MIFARRRKNKNALRIAKNVEAFEEKFCDLIICQRFDPEKCRNKKRIEILLQNMHSSSCSLIAGKVEYLFQHRARKTKPPSEIAPRKDQCHNRTDCAGDDRNADNI